MKHYRPIARFGTWLLDQVHLPLLVPEDNEERLAFGKAQDAWIEEVLGLQRARHGDTRASIYQHHFGGFPTPGSMQVHYFNFPTAVMADLFQKKWGGSKITISKKESSRRNENIEDNFTIDDLKYLFGDPLPNVITYHLLYSTDHSGYFYNYGFMHQDWAQQWIPSAFIYRPEHYRDETREMLIWFAGVLEHQVTDEDEHGWQRGWKHYGSDVWEFDDLRLAVMFKLRFGEDALPSSYRLRRDSEKLVSQLSGISRQEGKGYIWERQANIPDYRIPREVG